MPDGGLLSIADMRAQPAKRELTYSPRLLNCVAAASASTILHTCPVCKILTSHIEPARPPSKRERQIDLLIRGWLKSAT